MLSSTSLYPEFKYTHKCTFTIHQCTARNLGQAEDQDELETSLESEDLYSERTVLHFCTTVTVLHLGEL